MASGVEYQVRLAAWQYGKPVNFSLAELGVLLTGLNRAFNKFAMDSAPGRDVRRFSYFPGREEPSFVRTEIQGVSNGSVILQVVSTVSEFAEQNVLQATFLAGILGNGAYDLAKYVGKETVSALRRVSRRVREERPRREPTFDPAAYDHPPDVLHPVGGLIYRVSVIHEGRPVVELTFTAEQRVDRL